MSKFILSTDKCCDQFASDLQKADIEYIPMTFISDNEVYKDTYTTNEEYQDFYKMVVAGKKFSTSGLNYGEIEEYFLDLLKKHNKDIVHISLSSGLSGTFNTVKNIAEELNKTNKNQIYVVDSLGATVSQNLMVLKGKELRDKDLEAIEVYNILNEYTKKLDCTFLVADLDCLKRGGRISGAKALVAKMIQIKPYLEIDGHGELKVLQNVMGAGYKKGISIMVNRFIEKYDTNENSPIIIAQTTDTDAPLLLKEELEKHTKNEIIIMSTGPVVASHTGRGLLGLCYFCKENKVL